MTRTTKVVIAFIVLVLAIPALLLTAPMVSAIAAVEKQAASPHPAYKCDKKHWKKYLGVSPFPNAVADFTMSAKVCWWTAKAGPGKSQGKVIPVKTRTNIAVHENSWAPVYGLDFWHRKTYRTALQTNPWNESKGHWEQWRQCQTVAGIKVCNPTGDFVVYWQFYSPYLIKRSDGSIQRWKLFFHKGEPGKNCGLMDCNIRMMDSD